MLKELSLNNKDNDTEETNDIYESLFLAFIHKDHTH